MILVCIKLYFFIRIASYNINRALPFFTTSPATHSQLLAFRPGETVGNWRDSNGGTGFGTIPFDVNVALVPANLRAIDSLARAGILNLQDLDVESGTDVVQMAKKWESEAPGMFEVVVDADTAEQRLKNFVQAVELDDSLLGNATTATSGGNVSFYALSLMPDGSPVEVCKMVFGVLSRIVPFVIFGCNFGILITRFNCRSSIQIWDSI